MAGDSCTTCCSKIKVTPPTECIGSTPLPSDTEIVTVARNAFVFQGSTTVFYDSIRSTNDVVSFYPMLKNDRISRQKRAGFFTCDAEPPEDAQRFCQCKQQQT